MLLTGECLNTLDQIIFLQRRLLPPLPVSLSLHLVLPGVPLLISSLFEQLIKVLMHLLPATSSSYGQLCDLRLMLPLLAQG